MTAEQIDATRKVWIKPASTTKTEEAAHRRRCSPRRSRVAQELLRLGAAELLGLPQRLDAHADDPRPARRSHSRPAAQRAAQLARSGASLPQIGTLLGHTAPATTARYVHLVDDDLRDLVERA